MQTGPIECVHNTVLNNLIFDTKCLANKRNDDKF